MMRTLLIVLLTFSACAQTPPPDQTGSVSGVVTDAITHMPVKKAMVTTNPIGNFKLYLGPQSASTDASGAFTLHDLPAGQYKLMFQHQSYPQARFGGAAKTVDVKAGETAGPVNVELIPGASVTGHIVDEDGDPLQGCFVEIRSAKNPEQGVSMTGSSASDANGEWRAFGIAAGKYTLSAQCMNAVFQPRRFSAGPDPPPSKAYARQYYPLAADPKSAQVVELTAGNEKSGVDFLMSPTSVTQIHGSFSPTGADWRDRGSLVMQLINRGTVAGASPNLEKGTFEFRQVFPGSYLLVVFSQGNDENRIGLWQRIEVSDKPLDLTLELKHAIELTGKVEIDRTGNPDNKITLPQINIQLVPQSAQFGIPGAQTQVAADGTFTLKGVMPAPWRVQMIAPMAYMKSAWLGSTEVTNAPLDLSSGAAGALRIIVGTKTATIRGSAPMGTVVMVQRVDDEMPFHGGQATGVDQNGQYHIGGLAPGMYRVIASENGGPMPEDGGQEVTVREGETITLDLRLPTP
jgi:hypothetical protein